MDQSKPEHKEVSEKTTEEKAELAAIESETRLLNPDLFENFDAIFRPDINSSDHPRDIEQNDMVDCHIDSDVDMFDDDSSNLDSRSSVMVDKPDKSHSSQSDTVQGSNPSEDRHRSMSLPTEFVLRSIPLSELPQSKKEKEKSIVTH